jgi:phosphate:Na+ symporter
MALMSQGMRAASGESTRRILASLAGNHLTGLMAGTIVTAVIQSSSATTVMVVGLVNGGLMTLSQALGVIMGANIGTTVTAHLIAFDLTGYALPAMGLGVLGFLFGTGRVRRGWARATFGFGCLFWGMDIMGRAVAPLAHSAVFVELVTVHGHNPLLGVITGALMTAVVQSSSATIGMLQSLAGHGLVSTAIALPVLLGDNIGTCVTALLAGLGASTNARRAAVLHLIINTLGALVFLVALPVVTAAVVRSSPDAARQIANAHTLFNVVNAALVLPFASQLLNLACWLVPDNPARRPGTCCLAPRHLSSHERRAVGYLACLGRTVRHLLAEARAGIALGSLGRASSAGERVEKLAQLQRGVAAHLPGTRGTVSTEQLERRRVFLGLAHDLEGMAGHAGVLRQLAGGRERVMLSPRLLAELDARQQALIDVLDDILACLVSGHRDPAGRAASRLQDAASKVEKLRREVQAGARDSECDGMSREWALQAISCLAGIAGHAGAMLQRLVAPGR